MKTKKNKIAQTNYIKGFIMGFRRSLRHQTISQVRIKIEKIKNYRSSNFFLGKKVLFLQNESFNKKKKIIWGKITSLHGRSGVFIAKFKKNLPPSSIASSVQIAMFPFGSKIEQT